MAYYNDQQFADCNNLTRIFIEPPDEASVSCEETDDEVPTAISSTNCEIVLRSGKRLNADTPNYDSQCELKSNQKKQDCDKKATHPRCKIVATRNLKCDNRQLVATRNSKCDTGQNKNRPRRKLEATPNIKCDDHGNNRQKPIFRKRKCSSKCANNNEEVPPNQSCSEDGPENVKGKFD